jgi:hypothetical protein
VVKGGEETRTPVNCFEFEYGLPSKNEEAGSLRGGRPSQGGVAGGRGRLRKIHFLKLFLKYKCLIKYINKYFFINRMYSSKINI